LVSGRGKTMNYALWLTNDRGDRIDLLDETLRFSWNRIVNGVGRCRVALKGDYPKTNLKRDYHIEIWRSPTEKSKLRLENIFFIRRVVADTLLNGLQVLEIFGVDPNELLARRIVAYAAGSAEANKTAEIDDMMKEIVDENLGASAGAGRDLTGIGFSIQADATLGPSITKAFSHRNVLAVLQDLSDAARIAGDEVYFQVVATSVNTFEFQTFVNQPGQDRRHPGGSQPIIFSIGLGNLQEPSLEEDYEDEINFVYAGGQGDGAARNIQTEQDDNQINQSIWNRREYFRDARHEATDAGVTAEAQAALAQGRPKRRFSGVLSSNMGARYGIDWDWRDRVTVEYQKEQFDGLIRTVEIAVDDEGKETLGGRIEVEDVA